LSKTQLALITGASRGIGMATAAYLARAGFEIIGTATGPTGIQAIEDALAATGRLRAALQLDVSNADSIARFFADLAQAELNPTVLVNNAGVTRDNLLLRMKDDEWETVISANLNAIFRLTRGCLKTMVKARYGRIINVTSVVGVSGNAGQSNYAAFTKSLAQEVASRGITVNAVAPGFIDTDMTGKLTDQQKEGALAQIPTKRMGHPDEIAAAIGFLASSEAAYITGETIHVNGGMYMV